jgi:hypothetical protein
MSTTFDILPKTQEIPSFSMILKLTNEKLSQYFEHYNIGLYLNLKAQIRSYSDDTPPLECVNELMKWDQEQYAYFFIEGYTTGIEAYSEITDQLIREVWLDELELKSITDAKQELIEKCLSVGHYWQFKRYSNQLPIYDLIYGFLAGSVAEVTDGLINTDDGAWDESIFPTTSKEFFESYFIPEAPVTEEYQQWTTSLIDSLKNIDYSNPK